MKKKVLQWLKRIEKPVAIVGGVLTILSLIATAAFYIGYSKAKSEEMEKIFAMQQQEIEMCERYNQTIFELRSKILEQREELIILKQEKDEK